MDTQGPPFSPGDQKVVGQATANSADDADVPPSSRTINRIWFVLMVVLTLLGVWCCLAQEWVAGVIMVLVGVITSVTLVKVEVSERMMLKRMRRRANHSSDENESH